MKTFAQLLLVLVVVVVGSLLLAAGCAYQGYNQAINMDEAVKSQWAQVENQLQRRYDLIPNLVSTVKGITGQEQKIFLGVAEARKAYFQASNVADKAEKATQVESALSRLMFLQEKYPELKSNESFLKLQDELAGTENRVAVERRGYNEKVQTLNAFVRGFPGKFFAALAGVSEAKYFEVPTEAKTTPKVDFSDKGPS